MRGHRSSYFFFFNDTATTEIYTLSLHYALPISSARARNAARARRGRRRFRSSSSSAHAMRSEEHTSELQSPCNLVCRLLLEKKKADCATASVVSTSPACLADL